MELKSLGGDRLEDALHQTTSELHTWMDNTILDVYIVIQRGTKMAFFEFHSNSNDVEEVCPSVFGCTSLTQSFLIDSKEQTIMANLADNLEQLYHNTDKLKNTNQEKKELREKAGNYKVPCVFDLDLHENEINFLFHHMAHNPPRAGPDWQDYPSQEDEE